MSTWSANSGKAPNHSDYCAGCTRICGSAVDGQVPIGDVMRCLMYDRSYGDRSLAMELFKVIPEKARAKITSLDYSLAEKRCPQNMESGNLMRDAFAELSTNR